jgi:membrane fusion protein (multidrug efflux system)
MPPTPVEAAIASPGTVRDQFTAVGTLEAGDIITVTPEVSGIVRALPFTEGSAVKKGQLLARIDDSELSARLTRAEAILKQSQLNHDRAKSLSERGAIAQQQLDDAQAAWNVAEADLALVKAQMAKTRITAPFAGLVGTQRVSVGAYVTPGQPITELAKIDELKAIFPAPERFLGALAPGAVIDVSAPAFPGRTLVGKIDVIEPVLDASTRNVRLQARVSNPEMLFRPGMSANVAVTLSERLNSLTIPAQSVFVEGDQAFVYLINADSTVMQTPVTLGTRTAGTVEITEGLQPGAKVVSSGHQKLYPGAKVVPMMAGAAPETPPGGPAAGGESGNGAPMASGSDGGTAPALAAEAAPADTAMKSRAGGGH